MRADAVQAAPQAKLAAAAVTGATQVVLASPVGFTPVAGMLLLIDSYTQQAETRKVNTVAADGITITLATHDTQAYNCLEFVASTKTIRCCRDISSISISGTTVTVVTTTAHSLTNGDQITVYATTNFNTIRSDILPASSTVNGAVVTVVNATTFTYTDSTVGAPATETAGKIVRKDTDSRFATRYFPGTAFAITGAHNASNNGTFTVATLSTTDANTLTVNEAIVDDNAATSTTFTVQLCYAHAAGAPVVWLIDGRIPLRYYAPKATSGQDDWAVIQNASWSSAKYSAWLDFEGRTYSTSRQLNVQSETRLHGVNTILACLASMAFPDSYTAHIGMYNPTLGSLGRLYIEDIQLNGSAAAGSNGLIMSVQQPGYCRKLRTQSCGGIGLTLCGQQYSFENLEQISDGVGLKMVGAAQFMWFYGWNCEQFTVSAMQTASTRPDKQGLQSCGFWGVHIETPSGAGANTATYFDFAASVIGLRMDTPEISTGNTGQTIFRFHPGSAKQSSYLIENVFVNGAGSANPGIVKDDDRGHTLNYNDFSHVGGTGSLKVIPRIAAGQMPDNTTATDIDRRQNLFLRSGGGWIGYGGQEANAPNMEFHPGTAATANNVEWYEGTTDTLKVSVAAATGLFQAAAGVATFTKAGAISDADFVAAPPIGTVGIDTTNNKIWIRVGAATWKSVVCV